MYIKQKDIRSAASQFLAIATLNLFPDTELIGASLTDTGFAYDFLFKHPLNEQTLTLIEERMRLLIKSVESIQPIEMMRENAANLLQYQNQHTLADLILSQPSNIVHMIKIGDFIGFGQISKELQTNELGLCKLLSLEQNEPEITRISGICCPGNRELKKFLKQLQAAKKNNHQILGPQLEIFTQLPHSLDGCWSWLPKGTIIKEILGNWWKTQIKSQNYSFLSTTKWTKSNELTDHLSTHKEIFRIQGRTHRKTAEMGEILHPTTPNLLGALRSKSYTKDTAFTFCDPKKTVDELKSSLQFLEKSINIFGIEYRWYLVSKKPNGPVNKGSWNQGVDLLAKALKLCGLNYEIDTEEEGIYGPRFEARYTDSLEREWAGPSLEYIIPNKDEVPIIAVSIFGSLERFVALLIEKSGGLLPLWIAPEQVRVVPVKEQHTEEAEKVLTLLTQHGVRANIEKGKESLATKVYACKNAKIPYAVIVGDKEKDTGTITVCHFEDQGNGQQQTSEAFIEKLQNECSIPL